MILLPAQYKLSRSPCSLPYFSSVLCLMQSLFQHISYSVFYICRYQRALQKICFVAGESNRLDLEGPLFIGGVGPPTAPLTVPPVLWAGVLRHGFVGCMRDLVINENPIDIAGYARQQDSGMCSEVDIVMHLDS